MLALVRAARLDMNFVNKTNDKKCMEEKGFCHLQRRKGLSAGGQLPTLPTVQSLNFAERTIQRFSNSYLSYQHNPMVSKLNPTNSTFLSSSTSEQGCTTDPSTTLLHQVTFFRRNSKLEEDYFLNYSFFLEPLQ